MSSAMLNRGTSESVWTSEIEDMPKYVFDTLGARLIRGGSQIDYLSGYRGDDRLWEEEATTTWRLAQGTSLPWWPRRI